MKRISPQRSYSVDDAYPSVAEHAWTRRRFLRGMAAAAAGLAGALAPQGRAQAAPSRAGAAPRGQDVPTRIRIDIPRQRGSSVGDMYPQRLDLFTRDLELIRFFTDSKERAGVQKAVGEVAAKATDDDFLDGKRLYALEQRFAKVLAKQVRRSTKRRVSSLDVMLYVGQGRRWHIRTGGVSIRPHPPRAPVIQP